MVNFETLQIKSDQSTRKKIYRLETMPTSSHRKQLLTFLESFLLPAPVTSESDSSDSDTASDITDSTTSTDTDDTQDELESLYLGVLSDRYLEARAPVPKDASWLTTVLPEVDDLRFRSLLRVSRVAFGMILAAIADDDVFKNRSPFAQRPIEVQLMVSLRRFGCYGNGASYKSIAHLFGISEGSVHTFTKRVVSALCRIKDKHVIWPSEPEKEQHKRRVLRDFGFPDCIGIVDGTHLNLDLKPVVEGEAYFSRKSRYGISSMVVCTVDFRIIYTCTGAPASVHDTRVWRNSHLARNIEQYFAPHEYLLADSGYPLSPQCIIPYKKPHSRVPRNTKFNYYLSRLRIKVEHCIGILKGRFQSLRGFRFLLVKPRHNKDVVQWFDACVVLHNMLLEDDAWNECSTDDNDDIEEDEGGTIDVRDTSVSEGHRKRDAVQSYVLNRYT